MTTPPVSVERRIGQRFAFNLPVSLRDLGTGAEGLGFTQDVSSRGVFFFTDMRLEEGAQIELTLKMPSEITLGEDMRVRSRGRVLRVLKPADDADNRIGVAVCLNSYEYLPEIEDGSTDFRRISALHSASETEPAATPISSGPRTAVHQL